MSAKDIFHNTVRSALEKDGWTITHDPLFLKVSSKVKIKIDLGSEKLLAAEKGIHKIAVEVKSFLGLSALSEFHTAVGQFLNYRVALENMESERVLYLAVPTDIYQDFFYRLVCSKCVRTISNKAAGFSCEGTGDNIMERLDYRQLVQKVIHQHATEQSEQDVETTEIVFDTERDRYLLLYVGWRDEERIHGCPIHVDIKDGKIWIQRDFTEAGIANQFLEFGVPQTDIVLGFRAPYVRQFTGFAIA